MMVDKALAYILDHCQIKIHQMPNFPAMHAVNNYKNILANMI